tara:strand:- start:80 stop:409 length:330 start_codon:yes stop_codon:yes gene_type:complete
MNLRNYTAHNTMKIKPLRGKVLAELVDKGERVTKAGVILMDDDGKDEGVRPRWFKCEAIGDDVHDIKVGEWILVEHGRWTREIRGDKGKIITRMVEAKSVLATSDVEPT